MQSVWVALAAFLLPCPSSTFQLPVVAPCRRGGFQLRPRGRQQHQWEVRSEVTDSSLTDLDMDELMAKRDEYARNLAAMDEALAQKKMAEAISVLSDDFLETSDGSSEFSTEVDQYFLPFAERFARPEVLDYNYGYLSKSSGVYVETWNQDAGFGPPTNLFDIGTRNFVRELRELVAQAGQTAVGPNRGGAVPPQAREYRVKLDQLVLSNEAIWKREEEREQVPTPLILKAPYVLLCWFIDVVFEDRPLPRFWFLETVARMPYFGYISMLHLYETLGWWRRSADIKRVHFAEEWNEFHHLLIMESLGGDQRWSDRFLAQHAAVLYYWVLVVLWLVSPTLAYNFSQLIEAHAVDTYGEFRDANAAMLKTLPPPIIAVQYYANSDMYHFDEFQTSRERGSRRPPVANLYDVFDNICTDEGEHVYTMAQCQDPDVLVRSPNAELSAVAATVLASGAATQISADAEILDELSAQLAMLYSPLTEILESSLNFDAESLLASVLTLDLDPVDVAELITKLGETTGVDVSELLTNLASVDVISLGEAAGQLSTILYQIF